MCLLWHLSLTQEKHDVMLVVKGMFPFKKCFMCTISTGNISSPNSLKMWKLCEHIYFIYWHVFTITSNAILCHVVLFLSQFDFLLCYSFSFSFLVVYVKTQKSDLAHNYNNKQYNSVLKDVWKYVTKVQALHNSVEMLFLFECGGYVLVSNDFQHYKTLKA